MRGIASVQWGITSVLCWVFSTVGIPSVQWGDSISTVGVTSVLWRVFSTVGDTFSTVGDNISNVEVAQYSGDKDLKYYEFSKNLEFFQSLFRFEIRSTTSHASIVDHG